MTAMRPTRREFGAALICAMLPLRSTRAATTKPGGSSTRASEVEALRRFAELRHPRGREAAANPDWHARWARLARDAKTLQDGAYFIRTRRALGWFQDGHTTVLPFEYVGGVPEALARGPFHLSLPYRVKIFSDGVWIVAAGASARQLLGAPLLRIEGHSAGDLMRAHATDWPGNDAWAQNWAPSLFGTPALLQGLGILRAAADPVHVEAIGADGSNLSIALRPSAQATDTLVKLPTRANQNEQWAAEAGVGNYARHLPDRQALYLSIDDMDDVNDKSFDAFTGEVLKALEAPALRRVIVDIRRNGGGDNFLAEPLRKRLENSTFNRPGGLYVLIGPATFSAAQNFATRLERETSAIFVGLPTGGAPNHYGDPAVSVGSATGITAIVSTLPWFDSYPQDQRPWIMPDLMAPTTFADWCDGRDPAFAMALSDVPSAGSDELRVTRRVAYDRASQRLRWMPFWRS